MEYHGIVQAHSVNQSRGTIGSPILSHTPTMTMMNGIMVSQPAPVVEQFQCGGHGSNPHSVSGVVEQWLVRLSSSASDAERPRTRAGTVLKQLRHPSGRHGEEPVEHDVVLL